MPNIFPHIRRFAPYALLALGLFMLPQAAVTPSQNPGKAPGGFGIDRGSLLVNSTLLPYAYPSITVEAGRPVRWEIDAPSANINGCNNRIFIREYGIEHEFKPGKNVIEFTPTRTGNFPYYCWMGMIPGMITVVGAGTGANGTPPLGQSQTDRQNPSGGRSCPCCSARRQGQSGQTPGTQGGGSVGGSCH